MGSPRGLVVPILRDADQMSIADIEKQIADFGKRAGEGKLGIEDLTGAPSPSPTAARSWLDAVNADHQPAAAPFSACTRPRIAPSSKTARS